MRLTPKPTFGPKSSREIGQFVHLGKFQSSTATPLDQNIVFELAGVSGTSCVTSHYSTILPPSTRNIATIARPRSWGLLAKWTCR